ncbi:MAG: hypothetical protein U1E52_15070 [Geminicoccaceae bacterium]
MNDPAPRSEPEPAFSAPDFLIAHGGPFYELQRQLGLLQEHALHSGRRALLAVGLTWGVPFLLALLAGNAWGHEAGERPFLLDLGVWARFFVATGVLVLSERLVEPRLRGLQAQFLRAPLLAAESRADATAAALRSLRLRDSRTAEVIVLVLAYLLSFSGAEFKLNGDPSLWLAWADVEGARHLTAAGWWCVLVGAPLFWFLLLRWLWRHLVWALLLRDVSRLKLRLVATHPDGFGGLAFVGEYPNAFSALVFAMTCVVAAETLQAMLHGRLAAATFPTAMGLWVVVVAVLFTFPLAAFGRPLRRLKLETLHAASAAATRQEREVERTVLGRNVAAPGEAEEPPPGGDPAKLFAQVRKLGTLPITKSSLLPLGIAAVLPLLAVGATQLPFKELLKSAKLLLL